MLQSLIECTNRILLLAPVCKKIFTIVSLCLTLLAAPPGLGAQERFTIRVDANEVIGSPIRAWNYFGYDEPNFTYMPGGQKLLSEISGLADFPAQIRVHNLLTSGDGTPALKWGSTNVYTEDASGRPVYSWTIIDRIFDAYRKAGVRPFVEIGFMPEALSSHPQPYRHSWPKGSLWTGWAYPPKDYRKWAELIRQWVLHCVQRYGRGEVESWYWEVWNEPDIGYWQGTPEEYLKLYDFTADAVKRALPAARVGGPATTGPARVQAAQFLRNFLEHCQRRPNYATGKRGVPLDFISFHAKGRTRIVEGHPEMDASRHLDNLERGFEIVHSFPEFRHLPVVVSESDPEGCAACVASTHPENEYRNTPQYASYEAEVFRKAIELADRYSINLAGLLTWAFEFEDQPYFAGFRSLATNGIDLPVMNAFRVFGLLHGERIRADSTATAAGVANSAMPDPSDVNAIATRGSRGLSVLVWNYADKGASEPEAAVECAIRGIPAGHSSVLLEHYRIDRQHSNAYSAWEKMGLPNRPSPEQRAQLESAGQLQLIDSPRWMKADGREVILHFTLPSQAVSLLRFSW
jgi:xylan 1,4-beta-xylosidase